MAQSKLLNTYCRTIGVLIMFILPFIIVLLVALGNFDSTNPLTLIAAVLWIFLFLNSLTFTINGIMIVRDFKAETEKKAAEGFPIDSLEGFSVVSVFNRQVMISSTVIASVVLFSLLLFLGSLLVPLLFQMLSDLSILPLTQVQLTNISDAMNQIIMFSAIGLVFIAIGIVLLLKIPDKPAFEPGAMMKYYYPRSTPVSLDNLLSDALLAFLDPVTRIRFDEWTESIKNALKHDFEPDLDETTRLEQAREKTLLLFYLKKRMPILLPENVFEDELAEVVEKNKIPALRAGKESGISFKVLDDVFDRLLENIPEIFTTIDRLIIELVDNLADFRDNDDLWVTVSTPEKVIGNLEPFRILVFALNKNTNEYSDKKRLVEFHATGAQNTFMESLSYTIALDEAEELGIEGDSLPFVSDSADILGLLSKLLQIGDAVWFTFEREEFKEHLFSVSIAEEGRGTIYGKTVRVNVVRDINYFISNYGGKLSALTGLVIPFLGFIGILP